MSFISVADEVAKKSFTCLENKFITKYLPLLDPVAVKVYLFALYIVRNGQSSYTLEDLAAKLNLSGEEARGYFTYLEEFELVKVLSSDPFEIRILDCDNLTGTPKKLKPEKYAEFSTEIQSIITGRMISTNEFLDYYYLIEEYGFERNALLMIINYCVNLRGDDIRPQYIKKVASSFAEEGALTAKKVEEKLSSYTSSTPALIRIFTACGIKRQPDIDDEKLFQKWVGELGFSEEAIVTAAKTFKAKNTEKLDRSLNELYRNRKFDVKEIADYAKNRNSVYGAASEIARALGVYMQTADPYVENYVGVWINYGFEAATLKTVADYCFKHGKKSFEDMDLFIKELYGDGLVNDGAVNEKLEEMEAEDASLRMILNRCGLSRKIIPSDRIFVQNWRLWGFSPQMIFRAAELSSGRNNPTAYMNAVLSEWKSKGIFAPEDIPDKKSGEAKSNGKNYKAAQREKDTNVYQRLYEQLKAEENKDE